MIEIEHRRNLQEFIMLYIDTHLLAFQDQPVQRTLLRDLYLHIIILMLLKRRKERGNDYLGKHKAPMLFPCMLNPPRAKVSTKKNRKERPRGEH